MFTLEKRPRSLNDVIGHKTIIDTFKEYSKEGKSFPQIMMMTGTTGLGKTTTAQIVAQILTCEKPITLRGGIKSPCNECSSCKDVISERFSMDVVYKDCSGMGKSDVLALEQELSMGASYGTNKVILLEEAQELVSKGSKGALLKLLEKPRANTYIIIMTMNPEVFPSAVADRCQVYRFKKFKSKEISDYLMTLLEELDPNETLFPDTFIDVITAIADNSDGSMRKALQDFQRAIDSKIYTEDLLIEELEITTEAKLETFIKELLEGKSTALFELSKSDTLSNIFNKLFGMLVTYKKDYSTNSYFSEEQRLKVEFFVSNKNFNLLLDTLLDIYKDNSKYFDNNVFYFHILKFLDRINNREPKRINELATPTTGRRQLKQ